MSITAGCAVLEPWAALIAGGVGAVIFDLTCWLWLKLRIDDPLSASPMHGICGAWGVIVTGLLAAPHHVEQAFGTTKYGAFYGGGGNLLACQVIGVLVIAGWTCFWSGILFAILRVLKRIRITADMEQAGLDVSKHGGTACEHPRPPMLGRAPRPFFLKACREARRGRLVGQDRRQPAHVAPCSQTPRVMACSPSSLCDNFRQH